MRFCYFCRMIILFIIVVLLVVSNLVWLVLFVHIRQSYKKLMQKSIENEGGAEELVKTVSFDKAQIQSEQEELIIKGLQRLFEEERVYLNPSLTIQDLARRLSTNKTTLSHVINTSMNQNFVSLLNSYRVKESMSVLSDPKHFRTKMEVVGEMCGFNNRQVFHAAFKKEMGITPNHFRNIQIITAKEK